MLLCGWDWVRPSRDRACPSSVLALGVPALLDTRGPGEAFCVGAGVLVLDKRSLGVPGSEEDLFPVVGEVGSVTRL